MRSKSIVLLVLGLVPFAMAVGCGGGDETAGGSWWEKEKKDGGGAGSSTGGAGLGGSGGSGGTIKTDGGDGKCTGECTTSKRGAGTADPFDTTKHESANVSVDGDGALVLDRTATQSPHLIWIANSQGNVVSKVDTTTFVELGRYKTGTGDPSRTSVNAVGDVYVGNRGGHSVTKISASGDKCPDTNKDGKITTSHGPSEVLAYGQDDCKLWETPLNGTIRGVAADDKYTQVTVDPDLPPQVKEEHYVWVGSLPEGHLWKLDGTTGAVLLTTKVPCPSGAYGLALDGKGQLWMATNDGCVSRLDTNKCVDDASCNVPVCNTACAANGNCPETCDDAVKQAIDMPDGTYGITVDFKQRVWLGGGKGIKRYDPHVPAAQRYTASVNGFSHGIAADANGWIWGARNPDVVRLNGDSMQFTEIAVGSSKGMAVDKDGKIWAISYQKEFASVIVPGADINDNAVSQPVHGLIGPYTYSDMTGLQAALAKNDPGRYLETFPGCTEGDTRWVELTWDATVPPNTSVLFRVRTAATDAALASAKWVTAAMVPSAVPPVDLDAKFKAAGVKPDKFLDVEVWLSVSVNDQSLITPKVKNFGVTFSCPPSVT